MPESLFKDTLAQVFSCEFCEMSKNTIFYRTPPVAANTLEENVDIIDFCYIFSRFY